MADSTPRDYNAKRIMGPSWREVPSTVVMATERRVANLPALTYYKHQQNADYLTPSTHRFRLCDVNKKDLFQRTNYILYDLSLW